MKRIGWIIICILILLLPLSQRAGAESDGAEDLTDRVSFDFGSDKGAFSRVLQRSEQYQVFDPGASFSLTWEEPLPSAKLCISWQTRPEGVEALQYDADGVLLSREAIGGDPDVIVPLHENAREAVIQAGKVGMQVRFCAVYGTGELPEPFHPWQTLPDHIDYLLISTHPDDDVLYLGSVVPVYGAEQGYVGTIVYVTDGQKRLRVDEAENGAWAMGLRYRPVFLWMQDIANGASEKRKAQFHYDELLLNTVRVFRELKPAVVFAQDEKGEYGHWQHKLTSKAAREAFRLAADPDYDPASAEQYGTWQVQKLFLHRYKKNTIRIDAHTPLSFFDGKDAFEVACAAYKKHQSQQGYRFKVERDDGKYPFNRFGMAEGVVPVGEDVFDNIDETLLSSYVEPEPTPEPMPEPTAEPTAAPTPEPTSNPTPEPMLKPTAAPTPEPTSEPALVPIPEQEPPKIRTLLWIAAGTVLIASAFGVAAFVYRKRCAAKDQTE